MDDDDEVVEQETIDDITCIARTVSTPRRALPSNETKRNEQLIQLSARIEDKFCAIDFPEIFTKVTIYERSFR